MTFRRITIAPGEDAMSFSHPLARAAQVWQANVGGPRRILIVATTLELDPRHKRFKQQLVDGLASAAEEFVTVSDDVDGYCLINRLREWNK
jgi:hypothetical protein